MDRNLQTVVCAVLIFAAGMVAANVMNGWGRRAFPRESLADTASPPADASPWSNPVVFDYRLPETLLLCGEPVPLHERRVWEMLDREFNITVWDRAQVYMYLKRAGRYFPYIETKLAEAGLPDDLKYLAVAESALITHSESSKGARGPWQFMVLAARSNGLRRDGSVDERLNFERSTAAAIRNFEHLHQRFGSWALAMAAYNGGETRVAKAVETQKTDDYYHLNLPVETERYVFRIAAIKVVMENPARYGYHLSPDGHYHPRCYDVVALRLNRPIQLLAVAQAIESHFKALKELNPQFLHEFIPAGRHMLFVPAEKGMAAVAHLKKTAAPAEVKLVVSNRREVHRH
jgi:membrane-bound lytic murein transglycosylase D